MAGRVTQKVIEVIQQTDDSSVRVTQRVTEAVQQPTDARARPSQAGGAVLYSANPPALVSQAQAVVLYTVEVGSFNRTATDTTSVSESVAKTVGYSRPISDTTSLTESIAATKGFVRTAADTTSVTESTAETLALLRAPSDTTSLTESVLSQATGDYARTATDTVTASDSISRWIGFTRTAADTTTVSESIAEAYRYLRVYDVELEVPGSTAVAAYTRTATDSLTTTDALTSGRAAIRQLSDSAGLLGLDPFADDFNRASLGANYTNVVGLTITANELAHTGSYGSATIDIDHSTPAAIEFDLLTPGSSQYSWTEVSVDGAYVALEHLANAETLAIYMSLDLPPVSIPFPASTWLRVKALTSADAGGPLQAKLWPRVDPEPAEWDVFTIQPVTFAYTRQTYIYVDGLSTRVDNLLIDDAIQQDAVARLFIGTRALVEDLTFAEAPVSLLSETVTPDPDIPTGELPGGLPPALVSVRIEGTEYGPDVSFDRSRFTTYANGNPGTAEVWIRDLERTKTIPVGAEIIVRFRNIKVWGGFVLGVRREYVFSAGSGQPGQPRYLALDCADYNILMRKRIYYDPDDPTKMRVKKWRNGTWDSVVLSQVVNQFLNLRGDRLSYDIQHVGTPALSRESCNPDAPDFFVVGSAGWTWEQVMATLTSQTGAIYYIDPERVFHHVDDSTKASAFGWAGLSDQPDGSTTLGYRDVEIVHDGTKLVNQQWTWGAGQGSEEMVLGYAESPTSIDTHGIWQQAELRYDLFCQDSVDTRALTWLNGSPQNRRGFKNDKITVRCTVFEPYFRVGDVVTFENASFGIDLTAGVRGAEITFPTPWDIQCVLTIGHEKDTPWNAYEFWFPKLDPVRFPPIPGIGPFDPWIPGGFVFPPIPWPSPPDDPCQPGCSCVDDAFSRDDTATGWGTASSGQSWSHASTQYSGTSASDVRVLSGSGVLAETAAPVTSSTSTVARVQGIAILGEGGLISCGLPVSLSFDFWWTGSEWQSDYSHNRVGLTSSTPDDGYWEPGFYDDPEERLSSSTVWVGQRHRQWLEVWLRDATIPLYRFRIYNAEGSLWTAQYYPTGTDFRQLYPPVRVGPALGAGEVASVQILATGEDLRLGVWRKSDGPSSAGQQILPAPSGGGWGHEIRLLSMNEVQFDTIAPFQLHVDGICLGTVGTGGTESTGCFETFTRTTSTDLGASELYAGTWDNWMTIDPYCNGSAAVIANTGTGSSQARIETLGLLISSYPIETLARWRFTGISATQPAYFEMTIGQAQTSSIVSGSYSREYPGGVNDSDIVVNQQGAQAAATQPVIEVDPGQWMWMRLRADDVYTGMVKVWADGDAEPSTWDATRTDVTDPLPLPAEIGFYGNVQVVGSAVEVDSIQITTGCPVGGAAGCLDTFNRTETGGWGSGPLGAWTADATQGPTWVANSLSVDGSDGVIDPSPNSSGAALTVPLASGAPVELLCKFYLRANYWNGRDEQYGLWLDSDITPFDFAGFFIQPTLTGTSYNMDLTVGMDTRVDGTTGGEPELATGLFLRAATTPEQYCEWTLWLRLRVEADATNGECKGKVWLDGSAEPSTWLSDPWNEDYGPDYSLASFSKAGLTGSFRTDGVTSSLFKLDFFEVAAGCTAGPCAGWVPGGLTEDPIMDGSPVYGEELRRGNPTGTGYTTYYTSQQYVTGSTEVWVDGLRIRLGIDYNEVPLTRRIEISDSITTLNMEVRGAYIVSNRTVKLPEEFP